MTDSLQSVGDGQPDPAPRLPIDYVSSAADLPLDQTLLHLVMSRQSDVVGNGASEGRRKQVRPTISVVIPALNEELNLSSVLPKMGPWVDEVILVDGQSKDATCQLALSLLPKIRIIRQEGRGKGDALRRGFDAASGDIIVAEHLQHLPVVVIKTQASLKRVRSTRLQ